MCFNFVRAIPVSVDLARQGRKRPAPSTARQNQRESVPPSFDTMTDHPTRTAAADTCPVLDLTFNRGNNEIVEDLSPSSKRTCRIDNPPGSCHPPHASSGRSTSHIASAFASAPPVISASPSIEVEELHISIPTT